jgi:hypothetical protein
MVGGLVRGSAAGDLDMWPTSLVREPRTYIHVMIIGHFIGTGCKIDAIVYIYTLRVEFWLLGWRVTSVDCLRDGLGRFGI